jgi:beta-1,4-N-acetylglucosaminyltransferase
MTTFSLDPASWLIFAIIISSAAFIFRNQKYRRQEYDLMICLGSGGHTAEMFKLLLKMDKSWSRIYVVASSDHISPSKIVEFEGDRKEGYVISYIPRSRHIHQSWLTTPFTVLYSTWKSTILLYTTNPRVIICNGPGTCVPLCLIGRVFRLMGICSTKILFVESFARVTNLSLSGKILYHVADKVVVQWEELTLKYPNVTYQGQLM